MVDMVRGAEGRGVRVSVRLSVRLSDKLTDGRRVVVWLAIQIQYAVRGLQSDEEGELGE